MTTAAVMMSNPVLLDFASRANEIVCGETMKIRNLPLEPRGLRSPSREHAQAIEAEIF
ncbi:hypothetical protein [Nonomuraea sp. NPDC050540]|uniref:hypothetical protein n=1 Tax=Nonomuraea sp. NPDC050540 TaxID=3364367 RepID=UPI003794D961